MQFDLSSNLSRMGTEVKVDGKALKGEIVGIDFDMYKCMEYDSVGNPMEEVYRFCCRVTTEVKDEDGTVRRFDYCYKREDDESEVSDSVNEITPKIEDIAKDLAAKMMGRKSVL